MRLGNYATGSTPKPVWSVRAQVSCCRAYVHPDALRWSLPRQNNSSNFPGIFLHSNTGNKRNIFTRTMQKGKITVFIIPEKVQIFPDFLLSPDFSQIDFEFPTYPGFPGKAATLCTAANRGHHHTSRAKCEFDNKTKKRWTRTGINEADLIVSESRNVPLITANSLSCSRIQSLSSSGIFIASSMIFFICKWQGPTLSPKSSSSI